MFCVLRMFRVVIIAWNIMDTITHAISTESLHNSNIIKYIYWQTFMFACLKCNVKEFHQPKYCHSYNSRLDAADSGYEAIRRNRVSPRRELCMFLRWRWRVLLELLSAWRTVTIGTIQYWKRYQFPELKVIRIKKFACEFSASLSKQKLVQKWVVFLELVLTFFNLLKMYLISNFHNFLPINFALPDNRINFLNLHIPYNVKYFLPQLYQKKL